MTTGEGNFRIDINDGVIELRKYSVAAMDKVKADGSRFDFLLDAVYTIETSILYISGKSTFTRKIASGDWDDKDLLCSDEDIETIKDKIWVSDDKIYINPLRNLFNLKLKKYIKRGHYLMKKGIPTAYKTSNFIIIE